MISTRPIAIDGWHFALGASPEGRVIIASEQPSSDALQALLDVITAAPRSLRAASMLVELAVGVHGQGLGYSPAAPSPASLDPEDEPSVTTYLARPGQPCSAPFWTVFFVGCDELTLIPHPVLARLLRLALQEARLPSPGLAWREWFDSDEARASLGEQSVALVTREVEGVALGVFTSGTCSVTRLLREDLLPLNWIHLYAGALVAPFEHGLLDLFRGAAIAGNGITCIPHAATEGPRASSSLHPQGATPASWSISVAWVEQPLHVGHATLVRLLELLTHPHRSGS